MKRFLLPTLLTIIALSGVRANAKNPWTKASCGSEGCLYIKPMPPYRLGDYVFYELNINNKFKIAPTNIEGVQWIKIQGNCANYQVRQSDIEGAQWTQMMPDTQGEAAVKTACKIIR